LGSSYLAAHSSGLELKSINDTALDFCFLDCRTDLSFAFDTLHFSEEVMSRRRSLTILEIVAVLILVACEGPNVPTALKSPSTASELVKTGPERELTFMTYNVYQGTELENSIRATTPQEFVAGATQDFAMMRQTNFAERAVAIAAEVGANHPDVIGLQEVALWRTGAHTVPAQPALTVDQDFLQILLDALAARGLRYVTVARVNNFDVQGPAFVSGVFEDVRLTDHDVILVRKDDLDRGLKISNPQSNNFATNLVIQTVGGPVTVLEGWASIDIKKRGRTIRFVTTHLDAFVPAIRLAQANELLAGPANTDLSVVLAGDMNTTATTTTYTALTGAGFVDLWAQLNPGESGFTCCQVLPAIVNPQSALFERVDLVLFRGAFDPGSIFIVGANPLDRGPSGLWPSDHAGLVATLGLENQP
jgi:endonuclease/exonuclease/phosphatase family metal-dependent hydrolase